MTMPVLPGARSRYGIRRVDGTIAAMQIQEVVTAPRSPWQNAYVERFIGSIRRECLDYVIVVNAAGLQRVEKDYVALHALADASKPRQGLAHSAADHAAGGRAHRRRSEVNADLVVHDVRSSFR